MSELLVDKGLLQSTLDRALRDEGTSYHYAAPSEYGEADADLVARAAAALKDKGLRAALGEEFSKAMGDKRACLMRGHGITTAGPTIEEATLTAIKLNELAEVNYRAALLGTPEPIPQEDIDTILRSTRDGKRSMHAQSGWRYYCKLLGETE